MGGGGGAAGEPLAGAAGTVSRIDRLTPIVPRFINARVSDSAMKTVARIAVARVNKLAVPRPLMKEPIPWDVPIPSPPPSLRWISTTPINAMVTNRWMIRRTVLNARFRISEAADLQGVIARDSNVRGRDSHFQTTNSGP